MKTIDISFEDLTNKIFRVRHIKTDIGIFYFTRLLFNFRTTGDRIYTHVLFWTPVIIGILVSIIIDSILLVLYLLWLFIQWVAPDVKKATFKTFADVRKLIFKVVFLLIIVFIIVLFLYRTEAVTNLILNIFDWLF